MGDTNLRQQMKKVCGFVDRVCYKDYSILHMMLTAQNRIKSIKTSIYQQCQQTIYINKKIDNKIAPNIT